MAAHKSNHPVRTRMLADLKRSGITPADAKRRGFEPITGEDAAKLLKLNGAKLPDGYLIPYLGPDGSDDGYGRVRLLGEYIPSGEKKPVKYLQPVGSSPHPYFDPTVHWKKILADPHIEIILVEGEKKTIALIKLGFYAVGLGGVWAFLQDHGLLPELVAINWINRPVGVLFDSDARYKRGPAQAREQLVQQLFELGAKPYVIELPTLPGCAKTGVDDFIVHHGKRARNELLKLPHWSPYQTEIITHDELAKKKIPPTRWIVPDTIPAGLIVFVGPPKVGKSWWVLQLAVAVSTGTRFFNSPLKSCEVLALMLEDTERRLQDRLKKVCAGVVKPANKLSLVTQWPSVEQHGLEMLERELERRRHVRLVIVDTLARLRARPGQGENSYLADYDALARLKQIADKFGVALLLVHHTRKAGADDPLDTVSGTHGIAGAADCVIVLKRARGQADATLHIMGRDVPERDLVLRFEDGIWEHIGDAQKVHATRERQEILELLARTGHAMKPSEIAAQLVKKPSTIRYLVFAMKRDGELSETADGYTPGGRGRITVEGGKSK
jgi:hypothetical protein